ncbi:MAG: colanic acid/amylovoran biosynthesis protein [Thermoleophilaceae bacterium]|nr:colanic acid/amylovoran biosynthesis protein [Thermoleophilaceae bacterium]
MPHVRGWPSGRPRILVTDAWLANAGDGAIALATQDRLARLAPGASIIHAAYQGDLLADWYPDLMLVPPLAGLVGVTPEIPEMREWDIPAGRSLVEGADIVLSQGGGFAMEHYDPWERIRAWELVVDIGMPFGFGAQSVGRFERQRECGTLRRVYGAAEVIAVRDMSSLANVIDLGAPARRVLVTADEVLSMAPPTSAPARRTGIACVLTRHPQQREDRSWAPPASPRELGRLVSELLRSVPGEHVTLLSTQQGLGHLGRGLEDDADLAADVFAAMPRADAARVRVVDGYLPPDEFGETVATHRGLVSMRMHAAIIALTGGVPTVLLNESFKVTAMFAMLGLEEVLSSPGSISWTQRAAPDLSVARERAASNDEVVRRLLAATPQAVSAGVAG